MTSDQFPNPARVTRTAIATACDVQLLFTTLNAADAELTLSFHDGVPSPLSLTIQGWFPANDPQSVDRRRDLRETVLPQFRPRAACVIPGIDGLREDVTAELAELIRFWRFSLGCHEFGPEFASSRLTVRNGILRDLVIARRFFLHEIPGLDAFAAALRGVAGHPGRRR
jgi:hypothetical protein